LTPEQAFQKLKHYCAYQERAHEEVKTKAYGFGLRRTDVEPLLSQLIEEGYLNEERFAKMFAGGRFRAKKWGRVKIGYELKQRRVSDYNIRMALQEIPEEEYQRTAVQIATKKWRSIRGQEVNSYTRQSKTRAYLQQRGFEAAVISAAIRKILDEDRLAGN
jgi:regulatory protein